MIARKREAYFIAAPCNRVKGLVNAIESAYCAVIPLPCGRTPSDRVCCAQAKSSCCRGKRIVYRYIVLLVNNTPSARRLYAADRIRGCQARVYQKFGAAACKLHRRRR